MDATRFQEGDRVRLRVRKGIVHAGTLGTVESVSLAASVLQKAGLIDYSRGQMQILDPEGLHEGACECLELVEAQLDRIYERPWRELADEQDRQ